jgi:molybdopterin-containing oxidoreductase family iron-sulfur binding subunit
MQNQNNKPYTRREFLRNLSLTTLAGISLPLLSNCTKQETEDFLQKHFREMTFEEKREVIAKLEERYFQRYGKRFQIGTQDALPNTLWGYGLELSRCIGCRRCVYACVKENNNSRYKPQLHWIRVLRLKRGNLINLENSEHYYDPPQVPEKGFLYLPVQCQQCEDPPCVKVCPVHATWKEPDGLVVVDYNWCIGCRYCIAACPYKGRVFNWAEPNIPPEEINTSVHYLGNRPRMKCAVDKCTFCIQRVRNGRYPACVEACPTGTRKFGNLLDPDSEIRYIIDRKRVFRLKEDLNTEPKFYYFFEA